jgi:hypothetical protein
MTKISQEIVWEQIWPVVEQLLEATLAEDDARIRPLLKSGSEAAEMHDLLGYAVFDVVLKTVLGRGRLGLTRAIEVEQGQHVYIEFAWPDPEVTDGSYTAAEVVSVKLHRYRQAWRVEEVNPATVELPLTEPRAHGIWVTSKAFNEAGQAPSEPWILPVALYAGALQIPLRPSAMKDRVEKLFMPGLQHRTYGILSLIAARRLWREFKKKAGPALEKPEVWAAAVEYIMNEQNAREMSQAAVGKHYGASLSNLLPRINQIKKALNIQGLDDRYSSLRAAHIILKEGE